MAKLSDLAELGQAVWLDYIRRSFIASGDLQALIVDGLTGVTSNPTIFEKAIAGSADYDEALHKLVDAGKDANEIYEALVLEDIQQAADLLRPAYQRTQGADGYVSLEASPALAHDTEGTISEARYLFGALARPNVMIKVPATPAGIPAIETLIGEGINVNVTLMFSLAQYEAVAEAYIAGLEKLAAAGGDVSQVASVASFFVSRVDTAVDRALDEMGQSESQGKIAIANAKAAYSRFRETFSGPRWERLASLGARVQRPLWASTSTKNPLYPDTLYVDSLIGPDTVNTLPPATLQAFLLHGQVAATLGADMDEAHAQLERLAEIGVDLDGITQQLLDDGVTAFARSFETLMASIRDKCEKLRTGWKHREATLGTYQPAVDEAWAEMDRQRVIQRIWAHDHTVWKPEPTEIANRLGWLHIADAMMDNLQRLQSLTEAVRADGYAHTLLLGMGGSSLAPEVMRKTYGVAEDHLDLSVLDSTDPGFVLSHAENLDTSRALFIVATKSGTTAETLSLFKYFYNSILGELGPDRTGEHFIAITDPGSQLADLASRLNFRATFLNDPNIGGRYSALSYFGLVPAALLGLDIERLLDRALTATCSSDACLRPRDNSGAWLGAIIGEAAKAGRDKLTLVASPSIASFGSWVEQLIAESTGKEGLGILPVVGEPLGPPEAYGDDRLFVHLRLKEDTGHDDRLAALEGAGHPVVRLHLHDAYDLGGQFFVWEMATAVAGHLIGINPFDQPNVEAAKVLARKMVAQYAETGQLPAGSSSPLAPEALTDFLAQAQPGAYVALQAYLQPEAQTEAALQEVRTRIRDQFRLATTIGYGPRFLHSTGQLHKGDAGRGLFIQLTADDEKDVSIPDEAGSPASSITFGVLKAAQALGDQEALVSTGRRVIRFHLGHDVVGGLTQLVEALL
jgi:transaldolase/glucose-6-phosphate isomerase